MEKVEEEEKKKKKKKKQRQRRRRRRRRRKWRNWGFGNFTQCCILPTLRVLSCIEISVGNVMCLK